MDLSQQMSIYTVVVFSGPESSSLSQRKGRKSMLKIMKMTRNTNTHTNKVCVCVCVHKGNKTTHFEVTT